MKKDEIIKEIQQISQYTNEEFNKYINTQNIQVLHAIKLYADELYYYTGNETGLEDEQYDYIVEILRKKDPSFISIIGAKMKEDYNKTELPFHMGSMNKPTGKNKAQKIEKWVSLNNSDKYIIEDKLDGMSCMYTYTNGEIKLYSRGESSVGSNISHLSKYINGIPQKLETNLSVRGELIIKKKVFETKYNKKNVQNGYKNACNMVAGVVHSKTFKEGIRDIIFVAYELVDKNIVMPPPSYQLELLKHSGFNVVNSDIVPIQEINEESLKLQLLRFRKISEYTIDGIIIQPDKEYVRNTDGNPPYAFAFKLITEDDVLPAIIKDIKWGISGYGLLKPVLTVEPIDFPGSTITNISGKNGRYIYDNKLGPGSIIEVALNISPQIHRIIKRSAAACMPTFGYEWTESGADIKTISFTSEECIKRIHSFLKEINVEEIGEQTIKTMYENGYNTLFKILQATIQNFESLPSFKIKKATKIYTNIHTKLQELTYEEVLAGSSIFGFGIGKRKIASLLKEIPNILTIYTEISASELVNMIISIEGFDEKTALKFSINIPAADIFIQKLKEYGGKFIENKHTPISIKEGELNGKSIVFTQVRDKELEKEIEKRGGKIITSISKNTSFLIIKNKDVSKLTDKQIKAEQLKTVKILTKEEFIKKYIK